MLALDKFAIRQHSENASNYTDLGLVMTGVSAGLLILPDLKGKGRKPTIAAMGVETVLATVAVTASVGLEQPYENPVMIRNDNLKIMVAMKNCV